MYSLITSTVTNITRTANIVLYNLPILQAIIKSLKLAGILCPGEGPLPCSGNGQCDFTIGQCTCNIGHQGSDCSGKISNM